MLLSIIIFLLTLSFLVLAHEFGHYWLARKSGTTVEEFGIGFPPRLWSVKKGETVFSINAIPLGGFVRLDGESEDSENPNAFYKQPKLWRAAILSGGVIMNILVAYFIFAIGFMVGMPVATGPDDPRIQELKNVNVEIYSVLPDSPANQAGILPGDRILNVAGQKIDSIDGMTYIIRQTPDNEKVELQISRGEEIKNLSIEPKKLGDFSEHKALGVSLSMVGVLKLSPISALSQAGLATYDTSASILSALGKILFNLFTGKASEVDVSGPVGVAVMTSQASQLGFGYFVQFVAMLSINLAVINILPFPALDGGRLFFLGIEAIIRRPIKRSWEIAIHNIGFLVLLLAIVVVTYQDVLRFGGGFFKAISSYWPF
jgi:regulator of sigma E protease